MTNRKFLEKLLLFSVISIPLFTLLLASHRAPWEYTLSMIGNWFTKEERVKFILWGIFTATALTFFLIQIYKKTKFKNKKAYRLLYLSAFFLILTVLTPTLEQEPIPRELRKILVFNFHALFAVLFAIFLILSIYTFTKYLSKINQKLSIDSTRYIMFTSGGSILLLTIFGMTGIFELFFFISLSIFLLILKINTKKNHLRK